jgi:hypothetical protein
MDVQNATGKRLNELRAHETHEPCKADEADGALTQFSSEGAIVIVPRLKIAMRPNDRFDACRARPFEARGILPV